MSLFLLLAAVLISIPVFPLVKKRLDGSALGRCVQYGVVPVVLLLLSTACLVGDSYNPFLYFQF